MSGPSDYGLDEQCDECEGYLPEGEAHAVSEDGDRYCESCATPAFVRRNRLEVLS